MRRYEHWKSLVTIVMNSSDIAAQFVSHALVSNQKRNNVVPLSPITPIAPIAAVVDVVFIAERKDYCTMMSDILIWWPLVAPGGLLGGQGYQFNEAVVESCVDSAGQSHNYGVREAVSQFAQDHDLQIVVFAASERFWWIRKPVAV